LGFGLIFGSWGVDYDYGVSGVGFGVSGVDYYLGV